MNPKTYLLGEDRGVSPVIGVILMVAITVILAAVIATFVMNMGPPEDQAPTASFEITSMDTDSSSGGDDTIDEITISHDGGGGADASELYITIGDSKQIPWTDVGSSSSGTVKASDTATVAEGDSIASVSSPNLPSDFSDKQIELIWKSDDSDTSEVLKTKTTPS